MGIAVTISQKGVDAAGSGRIVVNSVGSALRRCGGASSNHCCNGAIGSSAIVIIIAAVASAVKITLVLVC